MRLGFDAKRAFNNSSGLGNYSRFVLAGLQTRYPTEEYYLYTPSGAAAFRHFSPEPAIAHLRVPTGLHKLAPGWWRTFGLPAEVQRDKVQLFHGLSNELPYGLNKQVKTVVTIHDLIFIRFPQLYNTLDRQIYYRKFKYACTQADKIVAISEQTKADIITHYNIPAPKIEVIYQDCNPIFHTIIPAAGLTKIKEKYRLPDTYILCVGTVEPRKNQLQLLQAWRQAGLPENIPLVFIGRRTAYAQKLEQFIQTHNLHNRVQFLPYIPAEELPAIYQLAHVFVYPSIFEGFGIPILEALNSGVPVITSQGSCFSEAGGLFTRYVAPDNLAELAQQLVEVSQNTQVRDQMITAGREYALRFRPEKTIAGLYHLYRELLNE